MSCNPAPAGRREMPTDEEQPSSGSCRFWLDAYGCILDCCEHAPDAFGYTRRELLRLHVSSLLPALARVPLLQRGAVNPRLAFKCRCARFSAVRRDGSARDCILFVNALDSPQDAALTLIVVPHEGAACP